MYCIKCGKTIAEKANFCPYCGQSNNSTPVTIACNNIISTATGDVETSAEKLPVYKRGNKLMLATCFIPIAIKLLETLLIIF